MAKLSGNMRKEQEDDIYKPAKIRLFQIYCFWILFQQWFHTIRLFFMFSSNEKYGSELFLKLTISVTFVAFSIMFLIGYYRWKYFVNFNKEYATISGMHWPVIQNRVKIIVRRSVIFTILLNITITFGLSYVIFTNMDDRLVLTFTQPWTKYLVVRYAIIISTIWTILNSMTASASILVAFLITCYILKCEFEFLTMDLQNEIKSKMFRQIDIERYRIIHHKLCSLLQTADKFFSGRSHLNAIMVNILTLNIQVAVSIQFILFAVETRAAMSRAAIWV